MRSCWEVTTRILRWRNQVFTVPRGWWRLKHQILVLHQEIWILSSANYSRFLTFLSEWIILMLWNNSISFLSSQESKKRRRSESEETSSGLEASSSDADGSPGGSVGNGTGGIGLNLGLLTWEQYRPGQWSTLYNSSYQTLWVKEAALTSGLVEVSSQQGCPLFSGLLPPSTSTQIKASTTQQLTRPSSARRRTTSRSRFTSVWPRSHSTSEHPTRPGRWTTSR